MDAWGVMTYRALVQVKAMAQAKQRDQIPQDLVDLWIEMISEASTDGTMLNAGDIDG